MKIKTASLSLTNKCNFNCKHCSVNAGKSLEDELTFDEIKDVLNQLKKLNVRKIEFTGGEPLLKKDLFRIIKYTKSLDFNVKILTNGYLLSKENLVELKKLNINQIAISLDGSNFEIYRKIRPVREQIFNKVLDNIKTAANFEIPIKINTVLTKSNLEDILNIIDFSNKHKIDELRLCYFTRMGRGKDFDEYINPIKYLNFIKKLNFRGKTKIYTGLPYAVFKGECMLKKNFPLYIKSNGDFHLCPLKEKVGNLRKESIEEIFGSLNQNNLNPCNFMKIKNKTLNPICPLKKFELKDIT